MSFPNRLIPSEELGDGGGQNTKGNPISGMSADPCNDIPGPSVNIQGDNSAFIPSPRWGEYSVIKDGKDQKNCDGLSKFRNNFDCCHQVPAEGAREKFDGFMIPKPNEHDVSQVLNEKTFRTSSRARTATYEVFPRHDPCRFDKQGEFALCKSTRDAIGKFHHKLYCTPRYGLMYPEQSSDSCPLPETTPLYDVRGVKRVRFADDQGYSLETRPPPRDDWEQIANMAKWPKLGNDESTSLDNSYANRQRILQGTSDQEENEDSVDDKLEENKKDMDVNQNFHDLVPSIYNYKLPAALHQSDVPYSVDGLEEVRMVHESAIIRTFPRPTYPVSLLAEMRDSTEEISLMKQEVKPIPMTIPPCCSTDLPNYVDQWSNSSVLEKQKLSNKTCSQRRYHMDHPEPLPDLRDHVTYSKRVFFDGFNSSAYRG